MPRPLRFSGDDARALLEYNRDAFERFARRVRRLPRRGAFRRRGIGHASLFATLVHILNVQEVWLAYIAEGRNSDRELEALFGEASRHPVDWKGFDAYHARVRTSVDAVARSLTNRDLGQRVHAFWMPGRYTVRDALLQVTLEQAHHLGEIIGALWIEDRAPPEMTWIGVRRGTRRSGA